MSTYFPLRLVHAHLPAPPTIPNAIPELRVSTDKPFASDQPSSSELHPDHAVSAVHHAATGILARLIGDGHVLELRSLRLLITSSLSGGRAEGSEIIRIRFPERLLVLAENCIVVAPRGRRLNILLVSESTTVYRLDFPLGSFQQGQSQQLLFSTRGNDWCEEYEVPEEVSAAAGGVSAWTVVNEDNVILGGLDGGIIKLSRTGERSGAHHRASAKFRLPSLFSRSGTDEQVSAFAQFEQTIYAVSADRRLRAWNVETGACLRAIEVRSMESSSQELVLRGDTPSKTSSSRSSSKATHIVVVPHPDTSSRYSHLVIVFLAAPRGSPSAGSFVVYRVPSASSDLVYAGERECSTVSSGSELRGLKVTPPLQSDELKTGWRLYTVWDRAGASLCESVVMDDIFQFSQYLGSPSFPLLTDWQPAAFDDGLDLMDAAYFETMPGSDPSDPNDSNDHTDIISSFLSHLFHPGRFSMLSLSSALEEYTRLLPRDRISSQAASASSIPTLRKSFAMTVGSHLVLESDSQTGAPQIDAFRKDLTLEWLGIWARVRDLDKQSRWPLSMASVDDHVLVLTREGASAPVLDDVTGTMRRVDSADSEGKADFQALPEGSMRHLYPMLAPPQARSAATSVSAAGSFIASVMSPQEAEAGGVNALDYLFEHMDTILAAGWQMPVEDFAGALWGDLIGPFLGEDDQSSIRRILSECLSVQRALTTCLDILASPQEADSFRTTQATFTGFGDALVAAMTATTIAKRFLLAKNIMLVVLFHFADSADTVETEGIGEDLVELLSRCFLTYHRYRVLRWVSEQTAEEIVERAKAKRSSKRKTPGTDDASSLDIAGLKMDVSASEYDGLGMTYSLLHVLIARQKRTVKRDAPDALTDAASTLLASSGLISTLKSDHDLEPALGDTLFGHSILVAGLPVHAGMFSHLYPSSPGMMYLSGRAELELGQMDYAVRSFERAAAGCKDKSVFVLIPTVSGQGVSDYYYHVASLFAERGHNGPTAHFGQLALATLPKSSPASRAIWTRVFLASIALSNFEDAYSIMLRTPFLDLQRDFLGQLISVICESNEVGRLNQLGFAGLQKEVENLLSYKARNSDPLRFPNYYKVLYSWHVSRGDYRSVAADIMHQQGRRFAEASSNSKIPAFDIAAMQARSYLAAISALSLVEPHNAWISVPVASGSATIKPKRRRTSSWIPREEFSRDKAPIDILVLADLEREYTAVLTRLQLSTKVPDLYEHGISVSPEEIVGMLIDRNMFDLAIKSAASMEVDMTGIFVALARRCVDLFGLGEEGSNPSLTAWLDSSPLTSRLRGPPAALAQRFLQRTLEQHDSAKTNYAYRAAVSDAFFELNPDKNSGWRMPQWLVTWEMTRDPEGWISRAVKWGWVEEAVGWSGQLLRDAVPPELLPQRQDAADLPYTLFDRAIAAARMGDEKADPAVQRKVKDLEVSVKRRLDGLKAMSRR